MWSWCPFFWHSLCTLCTRVRVFPSNICNLLDTEIGVNIMQITTIHPHLSIVHLPLILFQSLFQLLDTDFPELLCPPVLQLTLLALVLLFQCSAL